MSVNCEVIGPRNAAKINDKRTYVFESISQVADGLLISLLTLCCLPTNVRIIVIIVINKATYYATRTYLIS